MDNVVMIKCNLIIFRDVIYTYRHLCLETGTLLTNGSVMNVRRQWGKLNEPIKICNFRSHNIGFFLLSYQLCMNVN